MRSHSNRSAFFFAGTVATTIGYGKIVPMTVSGKAFCMIFMCLGIPYFATMMSLLSESVHSNGKLFIKKITGSTKKFSVYYIVVGFIFVLFFPTVIFTKMEGYYKRYCNIENNCRLDWTLMDSLYFSLVSLSTIGFGDFAPREHPPLSFGNSLAGSP